MDDERTAEIARYLASEVEKRGAGTVNFNFPQAPPPAPVLAPQSVLDKYTPYFIVMLMGCIILAIVAVVVVLLAPAIMALMTAVLGVMAGIVALVFAVAAAVKALGKADRDRKAKK